MAVYRLEKAKEFESNPTCPVLGIVFGVHGPATDVHHVRGKVGKLLIDKRFWLLVSRRGHCWIDSHPDEARALGWLCRKGNWNSMRQPTAYEMAYRLWLRQKRSIGAEAEPDSDGFDLTPWEAKRIREAIEREPEFKK